MKHSNSLVAAIALGAATMLTLTSCAGTTTEPGDEAASVLRLGVVTPLTSFAPWEASWANQSPYLQAVYDTLLVAEPDGTVTEGLATAWEYDDAKTQLTLTLRDGVEFSDGSVLTAAVVAEQLVKFRDGTSENASLLRSVAEVTAPDDATVVITLTEADPGLLGSLTKNAGLIGAEAMFDDADAQTTPIGSGPYVLDEGDTVIGSTYVFTAKDDYWNADAIQYDEIVINLYGDATSLMNAVKGGQVDASASQTPTQIPEAEAAGFTANIRESDYTGFLLVDRDGTLNPALGDVRVRQAINHALDREALVKALAAGYGVPTTQIISPSNPGYDEALDDAYPYDVDKAKQLLAEAGYADGFTLVMPSNDFVPESEFAIYADQLAQIGITVEWEKAGDDLFGKMLGGAYAAFSMLLETDTSMWNSMQFSMLPWSPWNPFKVEDPKLVAWAAELATAEGDRIDEIAVEVNEYIVEQAWYAPSHRLESAFFTDADTQVELQVDNAYPYLWNIQPAS